MSITSHCTGCGNDNIIQVVESTSGDYPLCEKCNKKFKRTGKIPAEYLVNHLSHMIDLCIKRRN